MSESRGTGKGLGGKEGKRMKDSEDVRQEDAKKAKNVSKEGNASSSRETAATDHAKPSGEGSVDLPFKKPEGHDGEIHDDAISESKSGWSQKKKQIKVENSQNAAFLHCGPEMGERLHTVTDIVVIQSRKQELIKSLMGVRLEGVEALIIDITVTSPSKIASLVNIPLKSLEFLEKINNIINKKPAGFTWNLLK